MAKFEKIPALKLKSFLERYEALCAQYGLMVANSEEPERSAVWRVPEPQTLIDHLDHMRHRMGL